MRVVPVTLWRRIRINKVNFMTSQARLIAIYDFEFFPYALGDVLTWNVRTAMRCEELGKDAVDVYICLDEKNPASIYQRGLINEDNYELFFAELYEAFGTNPKLHHLHIYSNRGELIEHLESIIGNDTHNLEVLNDYLSILQKHVSDALLTRVFTKIKAKIRSSKITQSIYKRLVPDALKSAVRNNYTEEGVLNQYFIKYIYSHDRINEFYAKYGYVPDLCAARGCAPDVDELIARQFKGKKIVPFHLRQRRLDVGYGGDHTYERDSNFLEWYHFLKEAAVLYPEVQFVTLGRLQEKPLEILRLPNVTSLRLYGMGLGHELTLMLKSDLFIGTSSGFAALANFSKIPYFITRMNPGSCHAYAIPEGAEQLPFATPQQKLVYASETSELLLSLLSSGLNIQGRREPIDAVTKLQATSIDLQHWLTLHSSPYHSSRTTSRFYCDDGYTAHETSYLLMPALEKARQAYAAGDFTETECILTKIQQTFPELYQRLHCISILEGCLAIADNDQPRITRILTQLEDKVLSEPLQPLVHMLKQRLDICIIREHHEWLDMFKMQMQQINLTGCLQ